MPYVKRDASGNILALYADQLQTDFEFVPDDSAELLVFLKHAGMEQNVVQNLVQSDLDMVRVLEDLIEIMIHKNQIMLTDLPLAAQRKILHRQKLRGELDHLGGLIGEDDIL